MKNKLTVVLLVVFMSSMMLIGAGVKKVEVTVKAANIRSLPSLKGKIIGKAVMGEILKVKKIEGNWYKVLVKKKGNKYGFLHKVTVKEVIKLKKGTESVEKKVRKKKVVPLLKEKSKSKAKVKRKKNIVRKNKFRQKKLFSGFYLKGGLITKPKVTELEDKWIFDFGFDSKIGKYLTWGIEFQPYYRSYSINSINFKAYNITTNVFLNLKGGINFGTLWKALRFLTVYVGGGPGGSLSYIHTDNKGSVASKFKTLFAWHIVFGTEIKLGKMNIVLEFQDNKFVDSTIDPSTYSMNNFLIGLRF